ncbi:unnamed protein product [Rhizoctonia solani]|uniref:BTB domain-containing protein n=1 Tax=Rhizoctonia solani TaxID=456999 RepID=A0A8H3AK47_9AGAM|nr:unnamed protein product [Rhizoctonia solani]
MEVTHSEWHYYPRGDVVIQVGNRLYKLHRDILEIHSGFFKDMFSSPSSDDSEGSTEENPLRLPHELCTSKSFTILCRFMYPTKPGALPAISSKDLPIWEPVLETTSALDMLGIQQYILDQLASDTTNILPAPEKLLRWATRFDHEGLLLEGLRTFAYRRLPPSPGEVMALGEHGANVMFTRERLRTVLLSQPMTWLEDEICPHNMCSRRPTCRAAILKSIVQNLTISPNKLHKDDMSDIFQVAPDGLCGRCQPIRVELARALRKGKLDNVIQESSQGHAPDHD